MSEPSSSLQRRLARIGLAVGGRYGFALACGHAIAAHGILGRPSEDVDMFTDWHQRADFPVVVDEIIAAYRAEGYRVDVDHRLSTFARLSVTDLSRFDDEDFAEYGVTAEHVAALRQRVEAWRAELLGNAAP